MIGASAQPLQGRIVMKHDDAVRGHTRVRLHRSEAVGTHVLERRPGVLEGFATPTSVRENERALALVRSGHISRCRG